jgi:hypothetical protein
MATWHVHRFTCFPVLPFVIDFSTASYAVWMNERTVQFIGTGDRIFHPGMYALSYDLIFGLPV